MSLTEYSKVRESLSQTHGGSNVRRWNKHKICAREYKILSINNIKTSRGEYKKTGGEFIRELLEVDFLGSLTTKLTQNFWKNSELKSLKSVSRENWHRCRCVTRNVFKSVHRKIIKANTDRQNKLQLDGWYA